MGFGSVISRIGSVGKKIAHTVGSVARGIDSKIGRVVTNLGSKIPGPIGAGFSLVREFAPKVAQGADFVENTISTAQNIMKPAVVPDKGFQPSKGNPVRGSGGVPVISMDDL